MQALPATQIIATPQFFGAVDFPPLPSGGEVSPLEKKKPNNNRKGRRGRGGRNRNGGKVEYTPLDFREPSRSSASSHRSLEKEEWLQNEEREPFVDQEDEDYRLAMSLQEEFDRMESLPEEFGEDENGHDKDESSLPEVEAASLSSDEKVKETAVVEESPTHDYDADLALAMQLQAELDRQQNTSYQSPAKANEKVSVQRAARPSPLTDEYSSVLNAIRDDSDYDSEDDDYEEEFNERYNNPHTPTNYTGFSSKPYHQNVKVQGRKASKPAHEEMITKHDPLMDAIQNAEKLEKFVEAGDMVSMKVAGHAYNYLKNASGKQETELRRKRSNKKDRSTSDSVVDATTRMALYKMLNAGVLEELNGVISTGKESHVYHAITGENPDVEGLVPGQEVAVKIYNLDMGTGFKDRLKYVDGEFRYRHTPTQNSRKAIKVWAEKELRNLKRLQKGGIASPKPILLRNNVLIMSFIGENGEPAPRLKDANLSTSRLQEVYMQCIMMMRDLYQNCLLVHADLSEYNILYHKKQLYFIDVSQSIENDHENAIEFLKRDCEVMTNFFLKRRLSTAMSARELFEFVTDTSIAPENIDSYLDAVQEAIVERLGKEQTPEEELEEKVWRDAYIPRTLSELSDRQCREEVEGRATVRHGAVTGMKTDLSGPNTIPEILDKKNDEKEKVRE